MSKVMGIYFNFTKTTHQIWSCHLNLASNSENFYFLPYYVLILGKVTKFGGNWLKNKKVTGKKNLVVETPPPPPPLVLIGLLLLESHLDALRCIFGCLLKLGQLEILAFLCLVDHRPPHVLHEDQLQELHCHSVHKHSVFLCLRQKVSIVIPSIFSLIFWYCLSIVCWIFEKHHLSLHCPPFPFANQIFMKDQHVRKQQSESRLNNLTLSLISS